MNRFRFRPVSGLILICISLGYMVLTLPDETASTATAIRWAGLGLAFLMCGILAMLSGILAVLIERSKDENRASGGGTRLRDDRPNEPVKP